MQWEKVNISDFGGGGCSCNQALTLKEIFCESQGEGVTMKGFSAFLDLKRCKDWDCEISS